MTSVHIGALHIGAMPAANAAVLLLTVGIALIFFECNRPGSVLPGALGLLATLLAVAALWRLGADPVGWALLLLGTGTLLLCLLRPIPMPISVLATVCLCAGLRFAVVANAGGTVGTPVAILCGVLLGGSSTALATIARRARRNKGLD